MRTGDGCSKKQNRDKSILITQQTKTFKAIKTLGTRSNYENAIWYHAEKHGVRHSPSLLRSRFLGCHATLPLSPKNGCEGDLSCVRTSARAPAQNGDVPESWCGNLKKRCRPTNWANRSAVFTNCKRNEKEEINKPCLAYEQGSDHWTRLWIAWVILLFRTRRVFFPS